MTDTLTDRPPVLTDDDDTGPFPCCVHCTGHPKVNDHESPCPQGCSASAAPSPASRPRPGFANPEAALLTARAFLYDGWTAEEVREVAHPQDGLLSDLADAMDLLASGDEPDLITDYWKAALGLVAAGTAAGDLLAQAADPEWIASQAADRRVTPARHLDDLLTLAGRIKALAAAGVTQEKAVSLLAPCADDSALSAA